VKTYIGVYVHTKIKRNKSNAYKTELKNIRVAVCSISTAEAKAVGRYAVSWPDVSYSEENTDIHQFLEHNSG